MTQLEFHTPGGSCQIHLGEQLENLRRLAADRRILLVTDDKVQEAQGSRFRDFERVLVGQGESIKTLATVETLYDAFLQRDLDRDSLVVGVGGGIVCDLTGFAASTYQRGLHFGFAPTTLLAQVDAALGGKNGVNVHGYKNLVGLIRQPEFVLVDPTVLSTLPSRELRCGLAEVVKAAAIADADFFQWLEDHADHLWEADSLAELIPRSMAIKVRFVQEDEQDRGRRMLLNFGHTLGHALEKVSGHALSHGEAVALGMVAAARLSHQRGILDLGDLQRLVNLLFTLALPTRMEDRLLEAALEAISQDKKRRGAQVHWVLLEGLGHGVIHPLNLEEARTLLRSGS